MSVTTTGSSGNAVTPNTSTQGGQVLSRVKASAATAYLTICAAILLVGAFGYVAWHLMSIANVSLDDETYWNRLMMIFGPVSSLAFGAAGWLFGAGFERGKSLLTEKNLLKSEQDLAVSNQERERQRETMESMRDGGLEICGMLRQMAENPDRTESHQGTIQVAPTATTVLAVAERTFYPKSA